MNILDLCAGIGSFSYAAKQVDNGDYFTTVGCSEICSFANRVLEKHGYELFGDLTQFGVPAEFHKDHGLVEKDLVPCEETGFTSVTYEDVLEGTVEFELVIAGTPCQDISAANLGRDIGIDGSKSQVVYDVMRIVEDFEPQIVLLENTSALIRKGLHVLLQMFDRLDYVVEWQTISAAHFGYNHYRHRTFVVAYRKDSPLYLSGRRVFDLVSKDAKLSPGTKIPLPDDMTNEQREQTRVIDTRSIKLRTKRINAVGNAVVVDIAASILNAIAVINKEYKVGEGKKRKTKRENILGYVTQTGIENDVNHSLFDNSVPITKMPPAGYLNDSIVFDSGIDSRLNPKRTQYSGMFSTILNRDGNNNCSTASRKNRPGKLGGIIGDMIVKFDFNIGGLNPHFAESMIGLPAAYTDIFNADKV